MSFHHDYRRRCCLCHRLLPKGCSVCPGGCLGKGGSYEKPAVASETLRAEGTDCPARTVVATITVPPATSAPVRTEAKQRRYKCGHPAPFEETWAYLMTCRRCSTNDDALLPGGDAAVNIVARVGAEYQGRKAERVRPAENLAKPGTRHYKPKAPEAVPDLDADFIPVADLTPEQEGRKAAVLARKQQAADAALDHQAEYQRQRTADRVAAKRRDRELARGEVA